MSMANIKRQLIKANQKFSEKLSGAKLTEKGELYTDFNTRISAYKKLYEELHSKIIDLLQPNPTIRAKIIAANKLKIKSDTLVYPQTETEIAETFVKYRDQIGVDTPISESMNAIADTFVEVASFKYHNEEKIRNSFLAHLKNSLKEIEKINELKSNLESKRLEFDKFKREVDKNTYEPQVAIEVLDLAKDQFEKALEETLKSMANFLDTESIHIGSFSNFIQCLIDYQEESLRSYQSLLKNLQTHKESSEKCSTNNIELLKQTYKSARGYDPTVPCCVALYDFKKENDNELDLKENDIITLLSRVDNNWYKGSIGDNIGHFPINYVKVLVPLKYQS